MFANYEQGCQGYTWNDLKRRGIVNLEGRPSIGIHPYVYTLSIPPGSTPTVSRDAMSGEEVLEHLTPVPIPEPYIRKVNIIMNHKRNYENTPRSFRNFRIK